MAKIENTATMITAALVTTPALLAMPFTTASRVLSGPSCSGPHRGRAAPGSGSG